MVNFPIHVNEFFFRGVHGHFHGSLPWWKIEDFVISESAKLVGNQKFLFAYIYVGMQEQSYSTII